MHRTTRRWLHGLLITLLLAGASVAAVRAQHDAGAGVPEITCSELSVWHPWGPEVWDRVLPAFQAAYPDVTLDLLNVPIDQLPNKYTTEASAGGGPDVVIGPNDWVGGFVEADVILPLDDLADETFLANYIPTIIEAVSSDGQIYGVPARFETLGLFYNKDLVQSPPATTDDLAAMVGEMGGGDRYGLGLISQYYHTAGYLHGFGGQTFTEDIQSAFDSPETVAWLQWLQGLATAPGVFTNNDIAAVEGLFKEGKMGIIIQGPWFVDAARQALGADKIGVAPLPLLSQTNTAPKPFLGVHAVYVNSNSDDERAQCAFNFASWFTSGESMQAIVDAGNLPSRTDFDVSGNPAAQAFVDQATSTAVLPTIPEMGNVWEPADNMIASVLQGEASPEEAAAEAAETINQSIDG